MATPAFAEPLPALDRFAISAGVFANRFNLDGRIDGSTDFQGSRRDFDQTLDFAKHRRISLYEFSGLIYEQHQLELRYYSDQRDRSVSLDRALRFNGEVFPVQASLRGHARFSFTELTYTYWFRSSESTPLGLQVGVLRLEGELGLSGQIQAEPVGSMQGNSQVSEQVFAPLVGVAARSVLGERWRTYAEARLIRLRVGGVLGNALSARVGVEYFPWERLGLALQYGDSRMRAEQDKADLAGELEVGFRGPQLLMRLRF